MRRCTGRLWRHPQFSCIKVKTQVNSILANMSADWPRITIVTPSFNQVDFIEETIESVLSQGYPNLQYVIIDGGSTDGSAEIIARYDASLDY